MALSYHESTDQLLQSIAELGKCVTLYDTGDEGWLAEIGAREFYATGATPAEALDWALDKALGAMPKEADDAR